ncbi:sirohydrochlorin chelatase [Thalassobacillus devorans]|uniref:sirohydrochlorin chelatase n=1 Tax=Thalassobacillus devorans TaxID=279813 RepID=UPI0015949277|nr:sirohydrochlorin chelatase [Thalassobacillus devorans]
MMQAVLFAGHGSRRKEAAEQAVNYMEKTMELMDVPILENCFLELAKPDVYQGVERCIARGATRIAVVPVLLLKAGHAKQDIPQLINRMEEKYPEVQFSYGDVLGVNKKIMDVLVERISEQGEAGPEAEILLVGRGSSDQESVRDIKKIAYLLKKKVPVKTVEVCFLAAAEPRFEKKLSELAQRGASHVFILPYLLFTGVLMTRISKAVEEISLTKMQDFIVCDYIGSHPNLCKLLKERGREAVQKKRIPV